MIINMTFIPYDDNNLEHIINGPDYGQSDNFLSEKSCSWSELDSKEFPEFTDEIADQILKNHPTFNSEFII